MHTEHTVMKHPMAVQQCWITECAYLVEDINKCYIAHPFPCNYLDRRLRDSKEKKRKKMHIIWLSAFLYTFNVKVASIFSYCDPFGDELCLNGAFVNMKS